MRLEREMGQQGAEKVQAAYAKAQRRNQLTRLSPVRHLMHDQIAPVAKHLAQTVKAYESGRGGRPMALPYLKGIDFQTSALIGIRAILDGILSNKVKLTAVASHIGEFIEHEQQIRRWERSKPDLFYADQGRLDRSNSTDRHRAIVNVHSFNKYLAAGVFEFDEWPAWSDEVKLRVGIEVVNAILRVTGWYVYGDDLEFVPGPRAASPCKTIQASPALLRWLAKNADQEENSRAAFMPTVVPPRRWTSMKRGGYWTPYMQPRQPTLIRFHTHQASQRQKAFEDFDALAMPDVYDALHFLQEVPWRVNARVFDVASHVLAKFPGECGLPYFSERPLPPAPWQHLDDRDQQAAWIKRHPKQAREWKREAAKVYQTNIENVAKARAPKRILELARKFGGQVLYFPHMLDFRGRMYPIPEALQPQGEDLARGLLHFDEGKPITEANGGVEWLAIHLASAWGNDKVSYADRVAWVRERNDDWRKVASDPIGYLNLWKDADKPFQLLAAVFEWAGYLEHGDGFVSRIPVAVDGTCNGIQHLSAMTRDLEAGRHVNLTPNEKPADIYKHVAELLRLAMLEIERDSAASGSSDLRPAGERGKAAKYWLDALGREPGSWPRSMTKRPVMVVPYGGTMEAFFNYTREWVRENLAHVRCTARGRATWATPTWEIKSEKEREERKRNFVFLCQRMKEEVHAAVPGAIGVMKWLQDCAKVASEGNQGIYWDTPTGFKVRHFYGKHREKKVSLLLDGHKTTLQLRETTDRLDRAKQLKGIAPNFVHSLDATALTMSINACHRDGITAFTAVHDAYGTHAADMRFLATRLREAFVALHEEDVLANYRRACVETVITRLLETSNDFGDEPEEAFERASERADELVPRVPRAGALDIREVLRSDYFFA